MAAFFIIVGMTICVIALAFWKDIKVMSERQSKRKKRAAKTVTERVVSSQSTIHQKTIKLTQRQRQIINQEI